MAKASRKTPLGSAKPYSSCGKTESQVEAPFSWKRSMACAREGGRISLRVEAAFECCSHLDLWTSALAES